MLAYRLMNATQRIDVRHQRSVGINSVAHAIVRTRCSSGLLYHCGADFLWLMSLSDVLLDEEDEELGCDKHHGDYQHHRYN
jgi:hypothetical protein